MPDSTASAFWSSKTSNLGDPKRQFRFKVTIGGADAGFAFADAPGTTGPDKWNDMADDSGGLVWYAKTVDKPGFQVVSMGEGEFDTGMSDASIVPVVENPTFKKVTMTLVDPSYPNATRKLLRLLRRTGYNDDQAAGAAKLVGGAVATYYRSVGLVQIEQLDEKGKSLEIWTLVSAYPAEVDFGTLSYASDDLVEIKITWSYSTFSCTTMSHGGEDSFTYFQNHPTNKNLATTVPTDACEDLWLALGPAKEQFDKETWKAANCPK